MNVRLLALLTAIVLGIGAAAYYFGQERQALQVEAFQPGPLTPGLEVRINDVDEARLQSQEGGVLTLKRADGQWAIQEHFGYRANQERVRTLLKAAATLEKIEPKTAKAENHARLNLEDPANEMSLATRITLEAKDEPVLDVVVGLNRPEIQGGGAFVRLWGEDQTWLTKEDFKPQRRLMDLIDRNVVNIDGRRMRSVRVQHPAPDAAAAGGAVAEMVLIAKATPDMASYSLGAAIPEGMAPKPDHELASVVRLPDFLILDDVQPASQIALTKPVVTVFETFDGLRLTFRAEAQADGKIWTTIAAEAADRTPGLEAFIEAEKGKDSEEGRIADQMKSVEAVAAEIAAIAKNVDGWAYRLTDYKTKRLTATTEDLVETPPPPRPAAPEGQAPRAQ